jgi:outer membrane receptor for ferrienterochelin and colicin
METVVVTGTHLANTETASPTLVFTREDFKKSGASTTQAFLATLPQNFGGTHSGDTPFAGVPGVDTDKSFGNAVNLRGLGAGATLVLIDGKRSAVAGNAEFVDIWRIVSLTVTKSW